MNLKRIKRLIASAVAVTTIFSNNIMFTSAATTTTTSSSTENVLKVNVDENGEVTYQEPVSASSETPNEDSPFTWDNALVYFVLTDRFENGDTSNDHSYGRSLDQNGNVISGYKENMGTFHGGDLKGLTKKLKEGYFTKIGVNAIWITAPYEQMHGYTYGNTNKGDGFGTDGYGFPYYGYHGYWALDFTNVDANMGTAQDMHDFVDTAHEHGIRVVMDVVMNHIGYISAYDANEYGYGKTIPNWKDTYYRKDLENQKNGDWEEVNLWVDNDPSWANWWGPDFVRTAHKFPGYTGSKDGGDMDKCLYGLPDIKMESTTPCSTPPFLVNKWKKEGRYEEQMAKQEKFFSKTGLPKTPQNYVVQWLSDWVREYGIDGFRCDTAKHIPKSSWGELKKQSNAALKEWRANNPDKAGSKWTDDFWMTGEEWGYGVGNSDYFTTGGFDSMINFSFQKGSYSNSELEGIFSGYATKINSNNDFNALSYISSHDTDLGLGGRSNLITAGNALLLLPGGAQIFYGDETGRQKNQDWVKQAVTDYKDQPARSDMNWNSIDNAVFSHWQKLGQFRYNHAAVGAGQHNQITASPYTFSRIYNNADKGISDRVVISIPGTAGSTTVSVGDVFSNGAKVRDAYTDKMYTVSDGKVTVEAGTNGVILLEKGDKSPDVGVSPSSKTYYTDTLDLKLSVTNNANATYSINDGKAISYKNGDSITIGSGLNYGDVTTVTVTANNEDGTAGPSTYTYTKGNPDDRKVKVKVKMSSWSGTPNIYVYSGDGTSAKEYAGKWPGTAMTSEGDGWYSYETHEVGAAKVIFNGAFGQVPSGVGTPGFDVEGAMQYVDGVWSTIEDKELKVTSLSPSIPSPADEGSSVRITAASTGGNGEIQYQFEVNSEVVQAYSSSKSFTWNADTAGTYKIKVTAKDSQGKKSEKEISYVVNKVGKVLKINSFDTNISSPQYTNTAIKLSANATGEGTVKYKFTVVDSNGDESVIKSYNTTSSATWTPSVAGNYELYVYAKDDSGNEKSDVMSYTIKKPIVTTLSINSYGTDRSSGQNVGTAIKLSASATGEGTVQYRFVAYSGTYSEVIKDFSTSSSATWTPKKAGTYNIYFVAKDSTGKTVQKVINNYVVKSTQVPLSMTSYSVDKQSPQNVGTSLKLSAAATGQGTVQYRFVAYSGTYKEVIKDFSTSSSVTWTPKKEGTYNIYFVAKDSTGKTVQKCVNEYIVKTDEKVKINSIVPSKSEPQQAGTSITLTTNATGNSALSYKYWAYDTDGNWTLLSNYSSSKSVTWTPKTGGNYVIWVDVKDQDGNINHKYINYKITDKVTRVEENNSKITYTGNWSTYSDKEYSGSTAKFAKSDAKATFKFTGTGIKIISATSNNRGVAMVTVDGKVYSADMFSSNFVFKGTALEIKGLASGTHTITISYSGIKSGMSNGTMIVLDAFDIIGGNII